MLATGLLIGSAGGAIAAADTESTGSPAQNTDVSGPSQTVAAVSAPTGTAAETAAGESTRPTPLRDLIRKLQSLGKPRAQTVVSVEGTDAVDTATEAESPAADTPAATGAPGTNVVALESNVTPPAGHVAAANSNAGGSPTAAVTSAMTAVQPVTEAVTTVADAALAVPAVIASLPTSTMPVDDVIAAVQNILVAVNDAVVPLAQLPSDLYSMLVVSAMEAPPVNVLSGGSAAGLPIAAGRQVRPPSAPLPPVPPNSPVGGMPLLGDVTAAATLGGIATAGLSADLSLSGTAPLAVEGAGPTSALSLFEHTVRAVLAPASLSALAAIALPGIGGLLIVCMAGIRVGYRQAKAALAARSTGIARFARQGPLGVVRSGSLVTLRPRSSAARQSRSPRFVRPDASRAAPLLEQVA